MRILHWPVSDELKKEVAENYRTNYAFGFKDQHPLEIIKKLTFDGAAPEISIDKIRSLFRYVEKYFLRRKIAGIGIEVGAGPATFSSILATLPRVEEVYAVEICRPIVEILSPKVVEYILDGLSHKVTPTIGDFDHLQLENNSVDFIFDFFSLHHSNDPAVTLKELHRVLKKDGFVFCFDKARPDHYTRQDLDELLDMVYDQNYNIQFGLPLDMKLTRRLNGEKEYRRKDWQNAFAGAGFQSFRHFYLAKPIGGSGLSKFIKNTLAVLPPVLQNPLNKLLPPPKFKHKFTIENQNRIFTKLVNPFPKEISLMIAYK